MSVVFSEEEVKRMRSRQRFFVFVVLALVVITALLFNNVGAVRSCERGGGNIVNGACRNLTILTACPVTNDFGDISYQIVSDDIVHLGD